MHIFDTIQGAKKIIFTIKDGVVIFPWAQRNIRHITSHTLLGKWRTIRNFWTVLGTFDDLSPLWIFQTRPDLSVPPPTIVYLLFPPPFGLRTINLRFKIRLSGVTLRRNSRVTRLVWFESWDWMKNRTRIRHLCLANYILALVSFSFVVILIGGIICVCLGLNFATKNCRTDQGLSKNYNSHIIWAIYQISMPSLASSSHWEFSMSILKFNVMRALNGSTLFGSRALLVLAYDEPPISHSEFQESLPVS